MKNIAIITGASSGLGVEIYKEIQKEALDEIWIIARREDRLNKIKNDFGSITTKVIPMDITLNESMMVLEGFLKDEDYNVKFLFNNAGFGVIGDVIDASYELQGSMVTLNAKALTEITTIVLKHMDKGSCIVNTCSIASFVPNARMSVYSATKGGIIAFTKAMAKELAYSGITVNCIAPGVVNTKMMSNYSTSELENIKQQIPLGRFANPSEIANIALFLACDEANYITGQTITIDGGFTL